MMRVLILKNITHEGPGTIEDYLKERNIQHTIVDLSKEERVKATEEFTHLVVMGGPMAVYEMNEYPYLKDEASLIEKFIKAEKPVLGVCLGAQMIAHVLGARVYPGGKKEIGWYFVDLTEEGMKDPAIGELSINGKPRAEVFQWHGDTFDLPDGSVRLASSELYENQAFRYSNAVYALQFHIEVTPEIIRQWFEDEEEYDVQEMVRHTREIYSGYLQRAKGFYKGFFQ